MAKEWANKDRYHPSHGVPEPRMPLSNGKGVGYTVPAWRDRRALGGGKAAGRGPPARPIMVTGQTGAKQIAGEYGFCGNDSRGFSPFSRGTDGRYLESGSVEFAGRSSPRAQYEFGRGRSFESQRGYGPCFLLLDTRTPPMRQEWSSHDHYVKTSNRSHNICNGPLAPVTSTHIGNG
jgi:hypothetical protein